MAISRGIGPPGPLHLPDALVPVSNRPFQVEGGVDFALGRPGGELVAPKVEWGRRGPVKRWQADPGLRARKLGVTARFAERFGEDLFGEYAGAGESLPPPGHNPYARAGGSS